MMDNEFTKNKKQIRLFCHRATHTGGVLLVAGIRGVGKTHLVDAALNERNEQGISRRVQVIREPKKLPRYLIKVDVDPFFPTDEKTIKADATVDENTLAFTLMRNIVFGLTSAIDSRYSLRKHGKTLRERLGFWRYWFAPNAIISRCTYLFMALITLSLSVSFSIESLLEHYSFLSWQMLGCIYPFCLVLSLLGGVFFTAALWMFWRWRDWRALAKMSAYLFALVNAHETSKTDDKVTSIKQELTSKLPVFLLPVLLGLLIICVATGSFKDIIDLIKPHKELAAAVLAIVAFTAVIMTETKNHDHAQYDQTNSAWMISLLRRYLFLCHRCGLEPVLVLDELDKLEELNDFWQESRQYQTKEKIATPKKTSTPNIFTKSTERTSASVQQQDNKLDMFLVALARLKSSLGAEFLWILISGPKLGERLKKHRHRRVDGNLGILATVITQEVVVGALDADSAQQIAKEKLTQQQDIETQTEPDDVAEQFKEREKQLEEIADVLWLRSYGNPATMVRMVESKEFFSLKPSDKLSDLAEAAKDLWEVEKQKRYFYFLKEMDYQEFLFDKWSQVWIHSGMLNLANRFIKEAVPYDYFTEARLKKELKKFYDTLNGVEPYEYFTDEYLDKAFVDYFNWDVNRSRIDSEVLALLSGNSALLQLVGEKMLFRWLVSKDKIIDPNAPNAGIYVRFFPHPNPPRENLKS